MRDLVTHDVSYHVARVHVTSLISPIVKTQHLLGSAVFTRIHETEGRGNWQVRARHIRQLSNGGAPEWDSSAFVEFIYLKIDGKWKLGGLRPHTVVATSGHPAAVVGQF
jgi:hypothetical protein